MAWAAAQGTPILPQDVADAPELTMQMPLPGGTNSVTSINSLGSAPRQTHSNVSFLGRNASFLALSNVKRSVSQSTAVGALMSGVRKFGSLHKRRVSVDTIQSINEMRRLDEEGNTMPLKTPSAIDMDDNWGTNLEGKPHTMTDFQLRHTSGVFQLDPNLLDLGDEAQGKCLILHYGSPLHVALYFLKTIFGFWDFLWASFRLTHGLLYTDSYVSYMNTMLIIADVVFIINHLALWRTTVLEPQLGTEYSTASSIVRIRSGQWSTWFDALGLFGILTHYYPLEFAVFRLIRARRSLKFHDQDGGVPGGKMSIPPHIREIFMLFLSIFVVVHIFSCVWFMAVYNGSVTNEESDVARDIVSERLLTSVGANLDQLCQGDFDLRCMTPYVICLGQGALLLLAVSNPMPENNSEFMALTFLAPCGAVFVAYIWASLLGVLQRVNILAARRAEKSALVSSACESLLVPRELRLRIARYHCFISTHHNEEAYNALFSALSVNLLTELKLFLFRRLIREASFLQICPAKVLAGIVNHFQEVVFSPGDIIIRYGEIGSEMYFIVKGTVEILDKEWSFIAHLSSGDYFGEVALLLPHLKRTAWARAKTYCVLARLASEDFNFVLSLQDGTDQSVENMRSIMLENISKKLSSNQQETDIPPAEQKSSIKSRVKSFFHRPSSRKFQFDRVSTNSKSNLENISDRDEDSSGKQSRRPSNVSGGNRRPSDVPSGDNDSDPTPGRRPSAAPSAISGNEVAPRSSASILSNRASVIQCLNSQDIVQAALDDSEAIDQAIVARQRSMSVDSSGSPDFDMASLQQQQQNSPLQRSPSKIFGMKNPTRSPSSSVIQRDNSRGKKEAAARRPSSHHLNLNLQHAISHQTLKGPGSQSGPLSVGSPTNASQVDPVTPAAASQETPQSGASTDKNKKDKDAVSRRELERVDKQLGELHSAIAGMTDMMSTFMQHQRHQMPVNTAPAPGGVLAMRPQQQGVAHIQKPMLPGMLNLDEAQLQKARSREASPHATKESPRGAFRSHTMQGAFNYDKARQAAQSAQKMFFGSSSKNASQPLAGNAESGKNALNANIMAAISAEKAENNIANSNNAPGSPTKIYTEIVTPDQTLNHSGGHGTSSSSKSPHTSGSPKDQKSEKHHHLDSPGANDKRFKSN